MGRLLEGELRELEDASWERDRLIWPPSSTKGGQPAGDQTPPGGQGEYCNTGGCITESQPGGPGDTNSCRAMSSSPAGQSPG